LCRCYPVTAAEWAKAGGEAGGETEAGLGLTGGEIGAETRGSQRYHVVVYVCVGVRGASELPLRLQQQECEAACWVPLEHVPWLLGVGEGKNTGGGGDGVGNDIGGRAEGKDTGGGGAGEGTDAGGGGAGEANNIGGGGGGEANDTGGGCEGNDTRGEGDGNDTGGGGEGPDSFAFAPGAPVGAVAVAGVSVAAGLLRGVYPNTVGEGIGRGHAFALQMLLREEQAAP